MKRTPPTSDQRPPANRLDWFLAGLGAGIRRLKVSLTGLDTNREKASAELREQARFFCEAAGHYGSERVSEEARRVLKSQDRDIAASVGCLLEALEEAQSEASDKVPVIMIAGGDREFAEQLGAALGHDFPDVRHVSTLDEATVLLTTTPVGVAISHVAPAEGSQDGCIVGAYAAEYGTLAIPVLYVGELGDEIKRRVDASHEDSYIAGQPEPGEVAAWIANRLRRARQKVRTVWRDRVTGFPSREFLRTCYPNVLKGCVLDEEPLCLVLIGCEPGTPSMVADRVGAILTNNLRSTDLIARWDSNTFAVLFPGEDQFGAMKAAENIQRVAHEELRAAGNPPGGIAIAAGISPATTGTSFDDVARNAERLLAKALTAGNAEIVFERKHIARRRANVLIVTCEPLMARVLTGMFEADDFRATVATDSLEALGCCQGHRRFQLILIDENTQSGGLETLRALKGLERNLRVPTLMLLSRNSSARQADYHAMGAFECYARPLQPYEFMARARELVWAQSSFHDPARSLCCLLVVADDPAQLYLVSASLSAFGGFRVSLAKGAEDGIFRLRQGTFDAVILPRHMLESDAAGMLCLPGSASTATLELPVIITTDSRQDPDVKLFQACAGVLPLPLDVASLGRKIESMLGLAPDRTRDRCPSKLIRQEVQRIADSLHPIGSGPAPSRGATDELGSPQRKDNGPSADGQAATSVATQSRGEASGEQSPFRRPYGRASLPSDAVRPIPCEESIVELGSAVRIEFVRIDPGSIRGGSPPSEAGREPDEEQHTIEIREPFWIGRFPVTQEQWGALMDTSPSVFVGARRPVESVSWYDACRFCEELSARIDGHARLPSEAEWEYACRSSALTPYYTGIAACHLAHAAWYSGNSGGSTHPVGRKLPNAFGLYDMHGNVWEWCQNAFGDESGSGDAGETLCPEPLRVFRGGCWCSHPFLCRAAYRGCGNPLLGGYGNGFRVVVSDHPQT